MKATRTCSIEDCDETSRTRGWCQKHYGRWRRTGKPEVDSRTLYPPVCQFPGCVKPHGSKGFCDNHARRLRQYGTPARVEPQWRIAYGPEHWLWKGDNIGIAAAHARVKSRYGLATDHPCLQCGAQARDWAYNHIADRELRDAEGHVYSGDPGDYMPLCRSCHLLFDRSDSDADRR